MPSYQIVAVYNSSKGYMPVASINTPFSTDVLDRVFGLMCHQPASDGVRIRPLCKQALRGTLRNMQFGDALEYSGTAYLLTSEGWMPVEYRKDHNYAAVSDKAIANQPTVDSVELPAWVYGTD